MLLKQLLVLNATDDAELDTAFERFARERIGALVVASDPLFTGRLQHIVALTARDAIPAMYPTREFVKGGGLMSYGTSTKDTFREVGVYTGRLLKGEKPADLPVQQAVRVQLALNLRTAAKLGITFPLSLLGRADEVIE